MQYRGIIIVTLMLAILSGCTKTKKPGQAHSKQTVYEMYLQRGLNNLNQYAAKPDSTLLIAAENYLDSASRQKNLVQLIVTPKVSLFLYRSRLEEGRKYVQSVDTAQFPRPYMKEMYLHFFDALIQNKKQDMSNRDASMKQAVAAVEGYLQKKPADKEAIADLFSLKVYSTPGIQLMAEMNEYKQKHPESKAVIDHLKQSLKGVIDKNRK